MLADQLGRPWRFLLTAGQVHNGKGAPALLAGIAGRGAVADEACDGNPLRAALAAAGMRAVIPADRSRKSPIPHDAALHAARSRIERRFDKLKHFRRIATRCDRRALRFPAFVHLASAILRMR